MMFASLLSMLMVVVMISLANASISKDVKEKVKALPAHVKQTVLGMKSQGVPKEEIAKRIKYTTGNSNPHAIIDGIVDADFRKSSPGNKDAKKRDQKRAQAVKAEARKARHRK